MSLQQRILSNIAQRIETRLRSLKNSPQSVSASEIIIRDLSNHLVRDIGIQPDTKLRRDLW